MYKLIFLLGLSLSVVLAKHELYDGHSLFEVNVKDVQQAKLVVDIETILNLDIWSEAIPERSGQVLVPKDLRQKFQEALDDAGVEYKITVENIKDALDLEDKLMAEATANGTRSSKFPFDAIHRYDVINEHLDDIARRFPDIVTIASAGRSFEGRDIRYLKISTTNFQDHSKPVVMMESLLHCREWVGLSVTLYAIQGLVEGITDQDLVRDIDWIIIPMANPDGYEFSHTTQRFWRKNRATGYMAGNLCMGVDLNRNFDIFWSTASSDVVCSDTFHGRAPFSEPETSAVRDLITEHHHRMALFLDIHSFGSIILYGYGNGILPPNGLLIHVNGVNMAQTIDRLKWENHPNYIVGNVKEVLYAASGSAQDYAQSVGVPYSYTYELPAFNNQQTTLNGFLVDPAFIEHAGFETWEGIKAGARYAVNNYLKTKSDLM